MPYRHSVSALGRGSALEYAPVDLHQRAQRCAALGTRRFVTRRPGVLSGGFVNLPGQHARASIEVAARQLRRIALWHLCHMPQAKAVTVLVALSHGSEGKPQLLRPSRNTVVATCCLQPTA